jgi:hypothetical protein
MGVSGAEQDDVDDRLLLHDAAHYHRHGLPTRAADCTISA